MDPDLLQNLTSPSPSDRARAANWLKQNPHDIATRDLMRALQVETVPRLRDTLNEVLEARQKRPRGGAVAGHSGVPATNIRSTQIDLAGLIRHELSPAVGWIRLAGDKEIPNFADSETNIAIKKLQGRIDGLVSLIKETDGIRPRRICLLEALIESWPEPGSRPSFSPSHDPGNVEIETDDSLFTLLLSNAYQNAIEASKERDGYATVNVVWGTTPERFWIRISNPFAGNSFSLDDVLRVGLTSKAAHQGQGVTLMRSAAERLGLTFRIEGQSGLATVTLTGLMPNA
jgi:hypothetical protein